jgi:hypothetical protein
MKHLIKFNKLIKESYSISDLDLDTFLEFLDMCFSDITDNELGELAIRIDGFQVNRELTDEQIRIFDEIRKEIHKFPINIRIRLPKLDYSSTTSAKKSLQETIETIKAAELGIKKLQSEYDLEIDFDHQRSGLGDFITYKIEPIKFNK